MTTQVRLLVCDEFLTDLKLKKRRRLTTIVESLYTHNFSCRSWPSNYFLIITGSDDGDDDGDDDDDGADQGGDGTGAGQI